MRYLGLVLVLVLVLVSSASYHTGVRVGRQAVYDDVVGDIRDMVLRQGIYDYPPTEMAYSFDGHLIAGRWELVLDHKGGRVQMYASPEGQGHVIVGIANAEEEDER